MPSAQRGQKRAPDPLGLELEMAMGHHVGSGKEPGSSGRSASVLKHGAICSVCLLLKYLIPCGIYFSSWHRERFKLFSKWLMEAPELLSTVQSSASFGADWADWEIPGVTAACPSTLGSSSTSLHRA